ncbi:hypothetical protein CK203_028369 [Vitis vinifera]|uniref:MuDRA-like transposase n=1 Tax=Vitis vinifera TaxID=29760 RepID=A0A438J0A9_VITVI|nr:hypothetical protein CK203_028369 [Vitis vinifera]
MLVYKGNWVQDGNAYHFKGSEDPVECSISMKYAFSGNIPTSPIQLRDDGDVKFFIRLNCTSKLLAPLCIIVDRRSKNNTKSMFMNGNGHVNDGSIESLNVVGDESIKKFNYEPLEISNVVEWNMNEYAIDDDYHVLDTNLTINVQVIENKDSSNKAAQIMEIHSIMNIKYGLMNDVPTMIEEVSNNDQDMSRIGTSDCGTNDDHIEEKQIYSSKKELQKKLLDMMSRDNRHASSWLVGESMRQTYQVGHQYRPKDIIGDIRNKYGVQISYDKAWRAREFALNSIRGSPQESYDALPSYCYMLEQKNPRTITDIVTDVDNQFKLPLPQPDFDREENPLDREEKATGREINFLASLDRSSIGRAQPVLDRTSTTGPRPDEHNRSTGSLID